jgi:ribonuclease HI
LKVSPSGRLNISIDGAFKEERGQGGIGVVVRNENGECIVALACHFPLSGPSLHMEAEACHAGLRVAIYFGWMDIKIESDCAALISDLSFDRENYSEVGRIINDCHSYRRTINSCQVSYVYREANEVANRLAHLASCSFFNEFWVDETHVIIQDVLLEDLCNSTRGLGAMSPSIYNSSSSNNISVIQ